MWSGEFRHRIENYDLNRKNRVPNKKSSNVRPSSAGSTGTLNNSLGSSKNRLSLTNLTNFSAESDSHYDRCTVCRLKVEKASSIKLSDEFCTSIECKIIVEQFEITINNLKKKLQEKEEVIRTLIATLSEHLSTTIPV
jgi:hypothetical protein